MPKNMFFGLLDRLRLIPEVKRGNTRVVLVFRKRGFALKMPIFWVGRFLRDLYKLRKYPFNLRCFLTKPEDFAIATARTYLVGGLRDNWRERAFYRKHSKESFLLPTYFSLLGLINIMAVGEELPEGDWMWSSLSDATSRELNNDSHHFVNVENFCRYRGRLCMRDYGGSKTQRIISGHFAELNAL